MSETNVLKLSELNLRSGTKFNQSSIDKGLDDKSFIELCNAKVAYFNDVLIKNRMPVNEPIYPGAA